jgi:malate dehydrogenase (oxaloacetate-decarboxylating)(NADP+)
MTISAAPRSTTTACRGPVSSASSPPSAWPRSATSALAYSPGVAAACEEIAADPDTAYDYTTRGNMVAVITNGTAVLGLGAIGAAGLEAGDGGQGGPLQEIRRHRLDRPGGRGTDPQKFIDAVAVLEPSFGAINLEDIKAPECFIIEQALRERMKIPVFHDDQHGTAIIVASAVRNGLLVQGKDLADVKIVTSGGGAPRSPASTCWWRWALKRENITVTDIKGVVYVGRNELMDPYKDRYARETEERTLQDALPGADVFLGLSAPRVLKPEWLPLLAPKPLVLALANPEPEILPEAVRAVRPDAIVATGRSDYPNQVNNVLCFPFIFRGALDAGATTINEEMKVAAVEAIARLARIEASEVVAAAYGGHAPTFGPDYIIPKPFDPRLILEIAPAVARAAMASGVAARPIKDFAAYQETLERFVYRSGDLMRPVVFAAKKQPRSVVYSEGEDERVLRAVQTVLDDEVAEPVLIGRREVIEAKVKAMGLRMDLKQSVRVLDPAQDTEIFGPLVEVYRGKGRPPRRAGR